MKIATWNVNGIRARAAQLQEWLEQERPDVVCLQELKAELSQIPEVCRHPDYHAYWHTLKGYSGVSLQVRKELVPADPVYSHPPFDMESRIVQVEHGDLVIASIYVPNGGKDYASKLSFLTQLIDWTRQAAWPRDVKSCLCGDMNIARTDLDVHPRERKLNAVGQRPDERALFEGLFGTGLVDLGRALRSGKSRPVHLVGAVAKPPRAQYRLAFGLPAGFSDARITDHELRGPGGSRDQ